MKPVLKHAIKTARGVNPAYRVLRWGLLVLGGFIWKRYQKNRQAKRNRKS